MAVYTRLLFGGRLPAYFDDVVYEAALTGGVVIRDIVAYPQGGSPATLVIYITTPGSGVSRVIVHTTTLTISNPVSWQGRQVLEPGAQLSVSSGSVGVDVSISGYVFGG